MNGKKWGEFLISRREDLSYFFFFYLFFLKKGRFCPPIKTLVFDKEPLSNRVSFSRILFPFFIFRMKQKALMYRIVFRTFQPPLFLKHLQRGFHCRKSGNQKRPAYLCKVKPHIQ